MFPDGSAKWHGPKPRRPPSEAFRSGWRPWNDRAARPTGRKLVGGRRQTFAVMLEMGSRPGAIPGRLFHALDHGTRRLPSAVRDLDPTTPPSSGSSTCRTAHSPPVHTDGTDTPPTGDKGRSVALRRRSASCRRCSPQGTHRGDRIEDEPRLNTRAPDRPRPRGGPAILDHPGHPGDDHHRGVEAAPPRRPPGRPARPSEPRRMEAGGADARPGFFAGRRLRRNGKHLGTNRKSLTENPGAFASGIR